MRTFLRSPVSVLRSPFSGCRLSVVGYRSHDVRFCSPFTSPLPSGILPHMPLDQIFISDLLVRGIIGINPDERVNEQDICINVVMWADTSRAAVTDDIDDAVNYRTISKQIIAHVDAGEPMLVERLVSEIADICLENARVERVEVAVDKPGALRYARTVGIKIVRSRVDTSA
jgi:FolB domain-containing protein